MTRRSAKRRNKGIRIETRIKKKRSRDRGIKIRGRRGIGRRREARKKRKRSRKIGRRRRSVQSRERSPGSEIIDSKRNILIKYINNNYLITRRWLTRTRSKASKTRKSKEPESPSVATDFPPCSRSPTNSSTTPKPKPSRSPAQSVSPTNTCVSAAEELPAVRVPRPGTTGK
jgi:hypothetical protein